MLSILNHAVPGHEHDFGPPRFLPVRHACTENALSTVEGCITQASINDGARVHDGNEQPARPRAFSCACMTYREEPGWPKSHARDLERHGFKIESIFYLAGEMSPKELIERAITFARGSEIKEIFVAATCNVGRRSAI